MALASKTLLQKVLSVYPIFMGIFRKDDDPEKESKRIERQEKAKELFGSEIGKVKSSYKNQKELLLQAQSGHYVGVSPQKLFQVTLIVAADRKYSITFIDKPSHTVTFQTNKREKFWDGTLSCITIEMDGGSRISVTGNAEQGSTTSGFSPLQWSPLQQMASEGAVQGEIGKLKLAIAKQVLITPEPAQEDSKELHQSTNTVSDIPTQIRQLKELHDSGVLSAEEFERAKAKLLG
jgi:hypothetical protein